MLEPEVLKRQRACLAACTPRENRRAGAGTQRAEQRASPNAGDLHALAFVICIHAVHRLELGSLTCFAKNAKTSGWLPRMIVP